MYSINSYLFIFVKKKLCNLPVKSPNKSPYNFTDIIQEKTELGYKFKHKTEPNRYRIISYTSPLNFQDPETKEWKSLGLRAYNPNEYELRVPGMFARVTNQGYQVRTTSGEELWRT